mmetsp:Transcript_9058/g.28489  ORF Transcript_9058/g.28489 Transcript_9058/m.28489 type:complete len:211 (-) Transcript_9058:8-640(-)
MRDTGSTLRIMRRHTRHCAACPAAAAVGVAARVTTGLRNCSRAFERAKDGVGVRVLRALLAVLLARKEVRDNAILGHQRVPRGAHHHVRLCGHAEPAAELRRVVGEHVDRVGRHAGRLRPRGHDERIVRRGADHVVDARRLELVKVLDERREVRLGAARRERAGHGKKHDRLALDELHKRVLGGRRVVGLALEELDVGQLRAGSDHGGWT